MAAITLTKGSIAGLMEGELADLGKPIVQILGFKKIAGQVGNDRFRLNISDGVHSHTFAMLATQLNELILDGRIDNNCVVRIDKIVANAVSSKKVFIVLELEVLVGGGDIGGKIGNPVPYTPENSNLAKTNGVNGTTTPTPTPVNPSKPAGTTMPQKSASAFYGQQQQKLPLAQPHQQANLNQSIGSGGEPIPIRDITPYNNKCAIKARVTSKSQVREWSNSRGDGKLFSIDLLDESGEIRMTGFNTAVDQFYNMLKVNDVYLFSKFSAKPANKQFSSLSHEYEISFMNDTTVLPCMDADADDIPTLSFNFTEIASIENIEKDKTIDVIGICKKHGDVQTFVAKSSGKEMSKRDLTLVDRSNTEIVLTLWGKQAQDYDDDTNPIIAVKGAKVGDFQGKTLSCLQSSSFLINPDINEAHALRGWYDNEGSTLEAKSLGGQRGAGGSGSAPWKMLSEVQQVDPSAADTGYYFRSKVTILKIDRLENAMYKACAEQNCNKKVTDTGSGTYRCEKCAKESSSFKWRLILNPCFGDCSDHIYATCFQEHGELILSQTTEYLGSIFEADNPSFVQQCKANCFRSFIAKFRAKMETYNNENRMKYSVVDLQPINHLEYAQALLAEIKELGN